MKNTGLITTIIFCLVAGIVLLFGSQPSNKQIPVNSQSSATAQIPTDENTMRIEWIKTCSLIPSLTDYCTCAWDKSRTKYSAQQLALYKDSKASNTTDMKLVNDTRGACKAKTPQPKQVTIVQINKNPEEYSYVPVVFTCVVSGSEYAQNYGNIYVCHDPNNANASIQATTEYPDEPTIHQSDTIRIYGWRIPLSVGQKTITYGNTVIEMKTSTLIKPLFIDNVTTGSSDYTK